MSSSRPRSANSTNHSPSGKMSHSNLGSPSSPGYENNSLNQSSSSPSMTGVLEAKNTRKRAEADLQLLSNRISLLRAEENKALQKVKEIKMRASEIIEIKRRNEDVVMSRIQQIASQELQTKKVQERAGVERDELKKKMQHSRKAVEERNKALANQLKDAGKKNEQYAVSGRQMAENENRLKVEEGRRRKEVIRQQKEKDRIAKEAAVQREVQKKIDLEDKKKRETEKVIDMLEKEERALIDRLKKTQEVQQQAIEQLQKSLEV